MTAGLGLPVAREYGRTTKFGRDRVEGDIFDFFCCCDCCFIGALDESAGHQLGQRDIEGAVAIHANVKFCYQAVGSFAPDVMVKCNRSEEHTSELQSLRHL